MSWAGDLVPIVATGARRTRTENSTFFVCERNRAQCGEDAHGRIRPSGTWRATGIIVDEHPRSTIAASGAGVAGRQPRPPDRPPDGRQDVELQPSYIRPTGQARADSSKPSHGTTAVLHRRTSAVRGRVQPVARTCWREWKGCRVLKPTDGRGAIPRGDCRPPCLESQDTERNERR